MERIEKEKTSSFIQQIQRKCFPFPSKRIVDSQHHYFKFEYEKSRSQFRVVKGVSRVNDNFVVCLSRKELVVADVEKKTLVNVNQVDLKRVKHNETLDLSVNGERWEGDVLNGKPYGWGVLYDKNNRRAYEGFRMGEKNVCYGTSYYADVLRVEYEGEWFGGERWGRGVQYDRNGDVVFRGEWLDNRPLSQRVGITPTSAVLHNRIEELVVSDGCCNGEEWITLDLRVAPSIKSLTVGNDCFMVTSEVEIVGLKALERVMIGANCFCKQVGWWYKPHRYFHLKNCPKLKELKIGANSFLLYDECVIENVDALEVIEMGELNEKSSVFVKARSLELKSVRLL